LGPMTRRRELLATMSAGVCCCGDQEVLSLLKKKEKRRCAAQHAGGPLALRCRRFLAPGRPPPFGAPAAAPVIHLGLAGRAVCGAARHEGDHVLRACHLDLPRVSRWVGGRAGGRAWSGRVGGFLGEQGRGVVGAPAARCSHVARQHFQLPPYAHLHRAWHVAAAGLRAEDLEAVGAAAGGVHQQVPQRLIIDLQHLDCDAVLHLQWDGVWGGVWV
jgi:hypothetical protein